MVQRALTVVQVLPAVEEGGVERGTLEVANALVQRGHRSIVISAGGRLVPHLTKGGSEHIAWPVGAKSPLTLRYVSKLRRLLRQRQVDVLHARSRLPAWIAYLAWRGIKPALRPHFVTTVHGLYSVGRYSAVMTRGERVIAVSHTVKEYLLKNYPGVPEQRIQVIPRGVDHRFYPFDYRPNSGWLRGWFAQYPQLLDAFVVTLPGRMTRLKGHEDFIELMKRLTQSGLPVWGLVVGGEDRRRKAYAEEIKQRAWQAGLDNLIFTGHRSDLREIFAVSNVVLSLSTQPESFGRTVLEALSLGVPVVGYDHGGVGEILNGLFPEGRVPLGDLDELTAKVTAFLKQKPTLTQHGDFTLQRMLDDTLRVYESLAIPAAGGVLATQS